MEEEFELPVLFYNTELNFPAKLLKYGYSFKLDVNIYGTKVQFEPDEERNWRALISYEEVQANKKLNPELLEAIIAAIENVTK